jgi:hypothetical protein
LFPSKHRNSLINCDTKINLYHLICSHTSSPTYVCLLIVHPHNDENDGDDTGKSQNQIKHQTQSCNGYSTPEMDQVDQNTLSDSDMAEMNDRKDNDDKDSQLIDPTVQKLVKVLSPCAKQGPPIDS